MDLDQNFLDSHNAREADEWKRKKANHQWLENAAKEAHKVRNILRLINNDIVIDWENLHLGSQKHLIADANNVVENPSITATELGRLYTERLIAWGDTDNPDLDVSDENISTYQVIEESVLKRLKECLVDSLSVSTDSD